MLTKEKRGVSAVIGYVLLISITLSLAVLVYTWLRGYVAIEEVDECGDNVQVVISDYICNATRTDISTGEITREGSLEITVRNKGLWSIDGYVMRFHTKDTAEFGVYNLTETGFALAPGESHTHTFNFSEIPSYSTFDEDTYVETMSLIDVQPFRENDEGNLSCQSYVVQRIECTDED